MRFRFTISAVVEYEVNPEHYPPDTVNDPQKMLACDLEGAEEDTFMFLDGPNTKWEKIKAEIV